MDDPKDKPDAPDLTEDPRGQDVGDGYPETAPEGANPSEAEGGDDEDASAA